MSWAGSHKVTARFDVKPAAQFRIHYPRRHDGAFPVYATHPAWDFFRADSHIHTLDLDESTKIGNGEEGIVSKEQTIERGNWSRQLDFVLSSVGFAVGLGNVWRFPYLAYRNGGATFLFPYVIMLAIAGLPLFFIEMALGQFTSQGPITAWKMSPFFAGTGLAMVIVSAVVCIYYNVIIAYAIYYMLVSFVYLDDDLPWSRCQGFWAANSCRDQPFPDFANATGEKLYNITSTELSCLKSNTIDYKIFPLRQLCLNRP